MTLFFFNHLGAQEKNLIFLNLFFVFKWRKNGVTHKGSSVHFGIYMQLY